MTLPRTIFRWTVSLALVLSSLPALAEDSPPITALAAQKAQEETQAPSWFKSYRSAKIRSFFARSIQQGTEPTAQEKKVLLDYLRVMFGYMDQDDTNGEFKNLMRDSVIPFVRNLTSLKLLSPFRPKGVITEPVGDWTLENFLLRHMLAYCAATKKGMIGTIDIVRRHSKGISIAAGVFLLFVGAHYLDQRLFDSYASDSIVSSTVFSFKSGPITNIMTALTAWFIQPTTEFVSIWMKRLTGKPQAFIKSIFNRLQSGVGNEETLANMNMKPRVSNAQIDKYNFGGLTNRNQEKLWTKYLNTFTAMQAHGPLLLDSQQGAGRNYVQSALTDAQASANSIFIADSNYATHQSRAENVLAIYESLFLQQKTYEKFRQLNKLYVQFHSLCIKAWTEELNPTQMEELKSQLNEISHQFLDLGVQPEHVTRLWEIQESLALATMAKITTTNVNELKRFLNPETNRNAIDGLREMEQTVYEGFGLPHFAQRHQGMIQRQQVRMGIENDGEALPDCNGILDHQASHLAATEKG